MSLVARGCISEFVLITVYFFREGRRASDGLVAQGILNNADHPLNSGVAFNSQRLHEACKAKGVLELHLLQKEVAQLKNQYQASVPLDELAVRQIQHSQFHKPMNTDLPLALYQCSLKQMADQISNTYYNKAGDLAAPYLNMFNNPSKETTSTTTTKMETQAPSCVQKPPLQQQLMQHRLLQQKRQILQKQGALEANLPRRQMLRQHSYKLAQQAQVLPLLPLPLSENETEDLLAFQAIVEGPGGGPPGVGNCSPTPSATGSPKMMKTSHITQTPPLLSSASPSPQPMSLPADCTWNALPSSMQTCQISEGSLGQDSWTTHTPLYQVYYNYH